MVVCVCVDQRLVDCYMCCCVAVAVVVVDKKRAA